jgi:hypothetical protein
MLAGMSPKQRHEPDRRWTSSQPSDIIDGITWGQVELEPEVADWLDGLDDQR